MFEPLTVLLTILVFNSRTFILTATATTATTTTALALWIGLVLIIFGQILEILTCLRLALIVLCHGCSRTLWGWATLCRCLSICDDR